MIKEGSLSDWFTRMAIGFASAQFLYPVMGWWCLLAAGAVSAFVVIFLTDYND